MSPAKTAAERVLRGLTFKDAQVTNALEMIHRALQVGPTPLRHKLSELIVQMRAEIWAFDQSASPWR